MAAQLIEMPSGRALVNQLEKDAHERKGVTRYYERDAQHLVIFYEDVIESSDKYAETFARVFKFIGVDEGEADFKQANVVILRHGDGGLIDWSRRSASGAGRTVSSGLSGPAC